MSGEFKSSTVTVLLSVSSLNSVFVLFIYVCLHLEHKYLWWLFLLLRLSFWPWCSDPLCLCFLSLPEIFQLRTEYQFLPFSSALLTWNVLPYPLTLSFCLSFLSIFVFWRHIIDGSCSFIHLATLSLLTGGFRPLTLRMIIDKCSLLMSILIFIL